MHTTFIKLAARYALFSRTTNTKKNHLQSIMVNQDHVFITKVHFTCLANTLVALLLDIRKTHTTHIAAHVHAHLMYSTYNVVYYAHTQFTFHIHK